MRTIAFISIFLCLLITNLFGERLKDITCVKGMRENQLTGYGLVVGLNGNGDTAAFVIRSVASVLKRFGINAPMDQITIKNVAAVIVTANINSFVKEGAEIDVTVSSLGDAKTLQGGVLLQTPLLGADDVVYAVAQGPLVIGGFYAGSSGAGGSTIQKNHPTVGLISGGAIVERSIPAEFVFSGSIDLLMRNPDAISAVRLADAINEVYPASSQAKDEGTVNVIVPEKFKGQEVNFFASLGEIHVNPDTAARIVVNEKTGTVVVTKDTRISEVAISYASLVISVANQENVSQPNALSQTGQTAITSSTDTTAKETRGGFRVLNDYPTIDRLVSGLNAFGVSTRDMISILQTLKSAGVLQAELIIT